MSLLADTMPAWSYIWYIAHIITDCLLLRCIAVIFAIVSATHHASTLAVDSAVSD